MKRVILATALLCAVAAWAAVTTTPRLGLPQAALHDNGWNDEANTGLQNVDDRFYEAPGDKAQSSPATETDEFDDTSVDGKWSWVNQGGSTVSEQDGYSLLTTPADSSINFRLRVQTAPSTPWTITARMTMGGSWSFYQLAGLCVYDNSGGDLRLWGWDDDFNMRLFSAASVTATPSAVYTVPFNGRSACQYLRVKNDGTNLIFYSSCDGVTWIQEYSEALSGNLGTADRVGFCAGTANSTATTLAVYWFHRT